MSQPFHALLALPILLGALATPALALEGSGFGASFGGGFVGPYTGGVPNTQFSSGLHYRLEPLGPYTEAMLSYVTRSQSLSAGRDYVFETAGLNASIGAKAFFLHAGVGAEVAYLRAIRPSATAPGQLEFANGAGVLVEPYVGVTLPFINTGFSELELKLHWPVPVLNRLDPSVGPRLMLTLWLGTPVGEDDEDEDEDTDIDDDEDEDDDTDGGDDADSDDDTDDSDDDDEEDEDN